MQTVRCNCGHEAGCQRACRTEERACTAAARDARPPPSTVPRRYPRLKAGLGPRSNAFCASIAGGPEEDFPLASLSGAAWEVTEGNSYALRVNPSCAPSQRPARQSWCRSKWCWRARCSASPRHPPPAVFLRRARGGCDRRCRCVFGGARVEKSSALSGMADWGSRA